MYACFTHARRTSISFTNELQPERVLDAILPCGDAMLQSAEGCAWRTRSTCCTVCCTHRTACGSYRTACRTHHTADALLVLPATPTVLPAALLALSAGLVSYCLTVLFIVPPHCIALQVAAIKAFAGLRYADEAFWTDAAVHATRSMSEMRPQQLQHIAWGFAVRGKQETQLYASVATRAQAVAAELKPVHAAILVGGAVGGAWLWGLVAPVGAVEIRLRYGCDAVGAVVMR